MIKAEIRSDRGAAKIIRVEVNGEKSAVLEEYMSIVDGLHSHLKERIGEKDARSLLEELTQKALDEVRKETVTEEVEQKFNEIKTNPEKVAKLLKTLFED